MNEKNGWLARRRDRRRLRRERTGDTPQKRAERGRAVAPRSSTDAMARTGTVGFLSGGF
jgi:hypothetical protein